MSSLWSCLIQIKLLLGNLKYITFPRYLSMPPQCLGPCVKYDTNFGVPSLHEFIARKKKKERKKPAHGYSQISHSSWLPCWDIKSRVTPWKSVISQENESEGKFPSEDSTTERSGHFWMNDQYYQSIKFPSQSLLCIDINDTGPYVTGKIDQVWNIDHNSHVWHFHLKKNGWEGIKYSQKLWQ